MTTSAKNGSRRALRLAAALLAGSVIPILAATPAHAQASQASIRGTITTQPDNPARQVVAVEVNTGYRRTTEVTADGSYNFASLRPGTYRLEIEQANGSRQTDQFQLIVSQNAELNLDLTSPNPAGEAASPADRANPALGSNSGDIVVTGDRIRTLEGGEVGVNITRRLIDQLPQVNRNFLAFADLAPGVQFQTAANGNSSIRGGAQASNSVNVFIDGVSQKDFVLKNGITGQDSTQGNPFPQLAVGEYRVISSNYKAEFDQVSSVAITAVTKSGTNEFHGEGFFDYTDQSLRDARPIELFGTNPGKVATRDMQFGGALGGPIIKDVMHFFATYEGKRQQVPVDIQPGNGTPVGALPARYQDIFGSTNREFNEDLYFGKIDIVPTSSDLFEITGKYRKEIGQNLNSGSTAATARTDVDTEELRIAGRFQHTADNWVNDLNVSYQYVKWAPTPVLFDNGYLYQQINRNANASFTRFDLFRTGGSAGYQNKGQKGYTVQDDFTWTGFDAHTIKVGFKTGFLKLRTTELNFFNPLYTYNAVTPTSTGFNDTTPYLLQFGAQNSVGSPSVNSNNFQLGLYAQDDWDVTDRLTLNLGLRWDYERIPSYLDFVTPADAVGAVSSTTYPNLRNADYDINDFIGTGNNRNTFTGAFQPRIGFSYELDKAARFVVFGGYGRSYDRTQFDFLQLERSGGAFPQRRFQFFNNDPLSTCTQATASATCLAFDPVYLTAAGRQQLLARVSGGAREIRFLNNDLKVPYSDQFSLGLRTRFNPVQLEAGYLRVVSKDGFTYELGNRAPDGTFFTPDPNSGVITSPFRFTPPGFSNILLGTNGLETHSDSAYFKVTKTYSQSSPWSIDATYTYTQAEDNGLSTYSLDFEHIGDYPFTRTTGVPKHRFVAAASADAPLGLTLSGRITLESPTYLRQTISSAVPFQRVVIDNEAFGNGDRWGRRQIDIAVTKYLPLHFVSDDTRLRFRIDILNLFNDRNYTDYNNDPLDTTRTAASPTVYRERVGDSIGGNPPRTMKLTAGFNF